MITSTELTSLAGKTMHGEGGEKIGKIVDVYESTDGPEGTFVTVSTGLFGGNASFVPLANATMQGSDVVVPYDKELVKGAPRVDADQELTSAEEDRLYQHYSLTAPAAAAATSGAGRNLQETAVPRGTNRKDTDGDGVYDDVKDTAVGRDTSGLTTDDAMTRSEERLRVGVERVESGRARLRKRIVSETVTQTVPVSREEVRVTREPITDANVGAATSGPTLSEEEHEVVLREEVPVVAKETVAVERVRLGTETKTEDVTVTEHVRKENIEADTDIDTGRGLDVDGTPGTRR